MSLSFTTMVEALEKGETLETIESDLADVVQAVVDNGGTGTLTLSFELKRGRHPGMVNIKLKGSKTKLPRPEALPRAFSHVAGTHGGLSLTDSRQPELDFGDDDKVTPINNKKSSEVH